LSQLVRTGFDVAYKKPTPKPFQAEYEGSIPFTRSNRDSKDLSQNRTPPFERHSDTFLHVAAGGKKNLPVFSDSTLNRRFYGDLVL
jgi:hypothetical protein